MGMGVALKSWKEEREESMKKVKLMLGIVMVFAVAMVLLLLRVTVRTDVFRGELKFTCTYESEETNNAAQKEFVPELHDGKSVMRGYASQFVAELYASERVRVDARRIFGEKRSLIKDSVDGKSEVDNVSFDDSVPFETTNDVAVFQISVTAKDRQIVNDVLWSWFEAMLSENDRRRNEQHKNSMENLLGWVQKFKKDIAAMDEEIRRMKDMGIPVPVDLQRDREGAGDVLSRLERNVEILESPTNSFWQIRFFSMNIMEMK